MSRCVFDKMSEVQSSTSSRVPMLGANKDTEIAAQYLMWSKTVKAWASANKCRDALTRRESDLPKTAAEVAAATGDALAAVKRNNTAAAALTMAMNANNSLYPVLVAGETEAFPDGEAHLIWKALAEKFAPVDDLSPVEMEVDLMNLSLKEKQDPALLFDEIEKIEGRYGAGHNLKNDIVEPTCEKLASWKANAIL